MTNGVTRKLIIAMIGALLVVASVGTMMTGDLQVISFTVPTIAALLALLRASQAAKQIEVTHKLVNSRFTELLEITRSAAHAEGVLEGERDRDDG